MLEYKRWGKFHNVIDNAKIACEKSNNLIEDHFVGVDKMVSIGSGAKRKQKNYKLTRYVCYFIA